MPGRRCKHSSIETERLLIRAPLASDAPVIAAIWSNPDVTRYMGGPRDFEKVRQLLDDEARASSTDSIGFWPVVEKASGHVIGDCGLVKKEVGGQPETELVYVFASDSWGKGYATEAASALRDHAFHRLGLVRIIALIDPENLASARVAQKVGLQFEGETWRPSGKVLHLYAMGRRDGSQSALRRNANSRT